MLLHTEFLAVDTETNGRPGDECELTEVGAVLVGGGELHDEWESLVSTERPLGRGIQRFTGISQAMVADAPSPRIVLEQLAARMEARVLVAHSASFDRRVLRQAFERAGLDWPDPPFLCTVALARKFAPLVRQRKLAPLA
ncbi:MAG: 3'-5' exonuclease, partial [Solirubrobacterales bacterium]|nr:3'-5' exonuclease [Solirubrobacterales bacterium]